jgi:hypothetical protein
MSRILAQFGKLAAASDAARNDQGTQFHIRREDFAEADRLQPSPQHQGVLTAKVTRLPPSQSNWSSAKAGRMT